MQKKLNEDYIDSYCEKFASKVTDSFFTGEKTTITGKEILTVTPSKQTNLFIIKLLFRYWQGETKKLESPFFNYEHDEVKDALQEFMNVLSQHIEVHKNGFQMLLNHALKDTLYLLASPESYVEMDLEDRQIEEITEEVMNDSLKYLRIYKREIGDFLSDMRGLSIDDALDELQEEFEEFYTLDELEKESEILSQVTKLEPKKVFSEVLPEDFEEDEEFDNDALIAAAEQEEKKEVQEDVKPKESEEVAVPADMNWEDSGIKAFDDEEESDGPTEVDYTGLVEFLSGPDEEEENDEAAAVEKTKDEIPESVNEDPIPQPEEGVTEEAPKEEKVQEKDTEEEPATINDQFEKKEKTIVEHHEEEKGASIMSMISVNLQYMFVKELFKDDQVSFQNALYELEEQETFDDSVEFLVQGYAKEFKWDMQSTEVKEFLKVLFRKFRD